MNTFEGIETYPTPPFRSEASPRVVVLCRHASALSTETSSLEGAGSPPSLRPAPAKSPDVAFRKNGKTDATTLRRSETSEARKPAESFDPFRYVPAAAATAPRSNNDVALVSSHLNASHATRYPVTMPARWPMKLAWGTTREVKRSDPNGARFTGTRAAPKSDKTPLGAPFTATYVIHPNTTQLYPTLVTRSYLSSLAYRTSTCVVASTSAIVPTSITSVYRRYHTVPQPAPFAPICSTTPSDHSELMLNSRCTNETCEKLAVTHRHSWRSRTAFLYDTPTSSYPRPRELRYHHTAQHTQHTTVVAGRSHASSSRGLPIEAPGETDGWIHEP
mmetsp:Transcript_8751/g.36946  ORF Transcript_8751/g.36946 Transcript_8751/m.36946 type:complete len:332 (+) Transcript_8751:48-1043(+)